MELKQKVSIHNRFDIEVVDARTGKVKQTAQAENVITNSLYTALLNNESTNLYFKRIFWGSGTGTPSASDTTLFTEEGNLEAVDNGYNVDYATKVAQCTRKIQLDEQTSVGVEISEVGIGYVAPNNTHIACTHAMLEDMNGNQITIIKTDVDIINIYATVFIHWSSPVGSVFFENQVMRQYMFGILKAINTSYPFWYCAKPTKEIYPTWHSGSYQKDYFYQTTGRQKTCTKTFNTSDKTLTVTMERLAVADFNKGGIGAFWIGIYNYAGEQGLVLPTEMFYAGDNVVGEAIGTGDGSTKKFALAFDFAENAKIYVNGVQQSGVTVRRTCTPLICEDDASSQEQANLYIRVIRPESSQNNIIIIPTEISSWETTDTSSTPYRHFTPLASGRYIQNTAYEIGYASIKAMGAIAVYGSNDLANWTLITNASSGTVELTGDAGHYKFYKNIGDAQAQLNWNTTDGKAVIFDTAPAQGDVITADYHTPYVAKNSDHVFDLSVTFQFGEYTE